MAVGIVGYGTYLPKYRIKAEEIARVWGKDPEAMKKGLGIYEKTVPNLDEDAATIAVEAARSALRHSGIKPADIGAIYVGSESHPYAVKPTATIVGAAIEATPELTAADLEFACKAGTAAIQCCMGLVEAGRIKYGLAIGSDTSQGMPGDVLEYTASAGGAAFIIGERNLIAQIKDTYSFTTDTPDFWRREGQEFPRHGARFTGEPAYFKHVINCSNKIMERNELKPKDFQYAVFHQPNGRFPVKAAKLLGFDQEQIKLGLLTPWIGNTYSGSTPLGLARILDEAKGGDLILATSYGSGAGSDSFIIEVTKENERRRNPTPLQCFIDRKEYVDYAIYAKLKGKIKGVVLEK
ncbi:MAG: hydroxymethylglutaryl-CoA synthase [Candidatus Altiarchaeales archaeon]|nr:hydroxymethylglutaryl-CoA synthase [Candidatus Altiarchaeota archaeon]MBU4341714.1 hydroxymethylglutaryl-CoA synthase [Candidatus Altiarchaeota archaeon]MBU4406617.1 hydroxymethylglutaryl-CoA synthase [Candidatus Altiarchaeota archaeon]MBU4437318.1 hydroxymethylglutaryl-CoA synthase [Candidatus Altiarchaeota archaeon]MCG2783399.1 hydroxymethylglutaryl-CoA synthase [Candidatus Altiarchaeales archaeon]